MELQRSFRRAGLSAIVLGIVTTYALAGFAAAWLSGPLTQSPVHAGERHWFASSAEHPFVSRVALRRMTSLGSLGPSMPRHGDIPRLTEAWLGLPAASETPYLDSFEVIATGWPWRALRTERRFDLGNINISHRQWSAAFLIVREGSLFEPLSARVVPYGVHWPGLIANTAVWTLAWFAALMTITFARRFNRLRTNRCLECGYDLRGISTEVCPECGAPLHQVRKHLIRDQPPA